jgi:hypothetical protein
LPDSALCAGQPGAAGVEEIAPRAQLRLAPRRIGCERGRQNLEGDRAVRPLIVREKHLAHPSAAE